MHTSGDNMWIHFVKSSALDLVATGKEIASKKKKKKNTIYGDTKLRKIAYVRILACLTEDVYEKKHVHSILARGKKRKKETSTHPNIHKQLRQATLPQFSKLGTQGPAFPFCLLLTLVRMRSEGYGTWSVCLSLLQLASRTFIHPKNNTT